MENFKLKVFRVVADSLNFRRAADEPLRLGTVKNIPLDNGPIERQLSIALLNVPAPKGPAGQLVEILRQNRATNPRIWSSDPPGYAVDKKRAKRRTPRSGFLMVVARGFRGLSLYEEVFQEDTISWQ